MRRYVAMCVVCSLVAFGACGGDYQEPVETGKVEQAVKSSGDLFEVYIVRSKENPDVAPDCSGASFVPSAAFYGDLYSIKTKTKTGLVNKDQVKRVGGMSACLLVTDYGQYAPNPGYYKVELDGKEMAGEGKTALLTLNAPSPWVINAANMVAFSALPDGYMAGTLTSNSISNPLGDPSIVTGSFWTLRLVKSP